MPIELISTHQYFRSGRDGRALRREVERGTLVRVHPGVFALAEEWEAAEGPARFRARMRAVAERARGRVVFSHESAAELLGVPRIGPGPGRPEILVTTSRSVSSSPDVRRRTAALREEDVVEVDGLLVTSPTRTLLDLTVSRTFANAIIGGDALLLVGASADAALASLAENPGVRGAGRARAALAEVRPGVHWVIESASRANMCLLGLRRPVLQQPFYDHLGLIGFSDFWFPELGLIGECDGRMKYLDARYRNGRTPAQVLYDEKVREDRLRSQCRRFTRWDWDTAVSLRKLGAHLAAAGLHR